MTVLDIPPEVAPVLEAFYQRKLAETFGGAAPSPEQEVELVQSLLEAESVVPMMDGGEAIFADDEGWDDVAGDRLGGAAGGEADSQKQSLIGFLAICLVVVGVMFGGDVLGMVGSVFGGSGGETAEEEALALTPSPAFTPMALPAGLDDLVTSTGVRVPLVVPRTLEVSSSQILTTTTLPVLPVQVEVSDWPCPQQNRPVACWVYGTVVNYLVGLPANSETTSLMNKLQPGDHLRLRLSTERRVDFEVQWIRDVPRQNVEILGQKQFGLTMVMLGSSGDDVAGDTRKVAWATYNAEQDLFGAETGDGSGNTSDTSVDTSVSPAPAGQARLLTPTPLIGVRVEPTPSSRLIGLGQTLETSSLLVTPATLVKIGSQHYLKLKVENRGSVNLHTARWSVQAEASQEQEEVIQGTVEEKEIVPGQTAEVECIVDDGGDVKAWTVDVGEAVFRVEK